MKHKQFSIITAWSLAFIGSTLAIIVWGQSISWQLASLTSYQLFPLFGLLAFTLMWTQYMAGALRRKLAVPKSAIQPQLNLTGWAVLLLIVLHPAILIWQLWRDGFGLAPSGYMNYVGPSLRLAVVLGSTSLMLFLAYELRRWLKDYKWWGWVNKAGDMAMVAIFLHALQLGGQVQAGWYHYVWLGYGVSLVGGLGYIYYKDRVAKSVDQPVYSAGQLTGASEKV